MAFHQLSKYACKMDGSGSESPYMWPQEEVYLRINGQIAHFKDEG